MLRDRFLCVRQRSYDRRWLCGGLLIIALVALSAACGRQDSVSNPEGVNKDTDHYTAITDSVTREVEEIADRDINAFQPKSEEYDLTVTIGLGEEKKIAQLRYTVCVKYKNTDMRDVVATAVLPQKMERFVDSYFMYITNLDASHCDLGSGKGEVPGFYLGRSFTLKKAEDIVFADLLEAIYRLRVKVSWTDSSGERHYDYILPDESSISVDEEVFDYFK